MTGEARRDLAWLIGFLAVLGWSGWEPHDRFVWFLEVAPAIAAQLVLSGPHDRQLARLAPAPSAAGGAREAEASGRRPS
jgi:hypothetical protein